MTTPDSLVETLAAQWDGCEYDTPGGLIDIGDAIRRAGLPLAAILRAEAERLAAQSAPDLDTMRTDFHQWCATNGYKTGFVNGGECPMGRPVYEDHRTHAAWWAFQKAAKLYGAQAAPTERDGQDAARLAFMQKQMLAADFDHQGECVLVFKWPRDVPVGADLIRNIDAAMAKD